MTHKPNTKPSALRRDRLWILLMLFAFVLSLVTVFIVFPPEVAAVEAALLITLFALSIASTFADRTLQPWSGKLFWLTTIVALLAWLASVILFIRTGRWWLMGTIFPTIYLGQRFAKYQMDIHSPCE